MEAKAREGLRSVARYQLCFVLCACVFYDFVVDLLIFRDCFNETPTASIQTISVAQVTYVLQCVDCNSLASLSFHSLRNHVIHVFTNRESHYTYSEHDYGSSNNHIIHIFTMKVARIT